MVHNRKGSDMTKTGLFALALAATACGGYSSPTSPYPATYQLTVTITGAVGGPMESPTVTSAPSGLTCPGSCSAAFAAGTVVTLTAVGGTDQNTFVGWSGACSGTGACIVTMNSNQTVGTTWTP